MLISRNAHYLQRLSAGMIIALLLTLQTVRTEAKHGEDHHDRKAPPGWDGFYSGKNRLPELEPTYLRYMNKESAQTPDNAKGKPAKDEPKDASKDASKDKPVTVKVPITDWTRPAYTVAPTEPHKAKCSKPDRISDSGNGEVFRLRTPHSRYPEHKILKVYKSAVWGKDGKLYVRTGDELRHAALRELAAVEKLRSASPKLRELIPNTADSGLPGWLLKHERDGRPYKQLWSTSSKDAAAKQIEEVVEEARRILGPAVEINDDPDNFLLNSGYSSKPELKAWLSVTPLPMGTPLAVDVDGKVAPIILKGDIGSGANSRVYRVKVDLPGAEPFRVLKILKHYAPSRHPKVGTEEVRAALVAEAVTTAETLRKAPFIKTKDGVIDFSRIIPRAVDLAPGILLQEEGEGVKYESLWASGAKNRAKAEVELIAAEAKSILPNHVLSAKTQNFLFDSKTGAVTSWYDHLSDGPKAYESAGKSRPFKDLMEPADRAIYDQQRDARHQF